MKLNICMQILFKNRHNDGTCFRSNTSSGRRHDFVPKTSDNNFMTATDCELQLICNGTMICCETYSALNTSVSLHRPTFVTKRSISILKSMSQGMYRDNSYFSI